MSGVSAGCPRFLILRPGFADKSTRRPHTRHTTHRAPRNLRSPSKVRLDWEHAQRLRSPACSQPGSPPPPPAPVRPCRRTRSGPRLARHAQSFRPGPAVPAPRIAPGPFKPTWDSLKAYKLPDWFRDAKFGIWGPVRAVRARTGRRMPATCTSRATPQNTIHVAHLWPARRSSASWRSTNLWKAENWEPEQLMISTSRAGAKYFIALANHHDNFDTWNSRHQPWNSVKIGPKKDIVGT